MSLRLLLIFAVVFAVSMPTAPAMPPLTRRTVGIVQTLDFTQQRLVIRTAPAESLRLAFDKTTTIWRDSNTTSPDALAPGQSVQVSYRLPFFGPTYASRIIILSPAKPPNENNNPNRKTKP